MTLDPQAFKYITVFPILSVTREKKKFNSFTIPSSEMK